MNKILMMLIASISIASPALADQKTKAVELTVGQALAMLETIKVKAATFDKTIKEGDRDRVVQVRCPYEIGVTIAMAKNIAALQPVAEAFQRTVTNLMADLSGGKGKLESDSPEMSRFIQGQQAMLEAKAPGPFNLYTFSESELKVKECQYTPDMVRTLLPLLIE